MHRRKFLQNAAIASIATNLLAEKNMAAGKKEPRFKNDNNGFTVLFQGDSITDGNRTRNSDWNHVMGHGFAYIAASRLWCDYPGRNLHFFNRGISGNKITDLAARWQTDTIDLKPDLLSILVGINDCAAYIKGDTAHTAANFENSYRQLLAATIKQLPSVQLALCDPFVLPVGYVLNNLAQYEGEVAKRRESIQTLAKEFNAIHIPFQQTFNAAVTKAPADYWIWDGVHPMPAGHELMAREWLATVGKKVPQLGYGT